MQRPLEFTIAKEDFNAFLLPEDAWGISSEKFRDAVIHYYVDQFAPLGGNVIVGVDEEKIHVQWIPDEVAKDPFEYALNLLQEGELDKAVPLLETFIAADPDDVDTLYNLGMALSDLGKLDRAKQHLTHLVEVDPKHTNGWVALGVAHQRSRDAKKAVEALNHAVKLDPKNGYAHRNLGAILGSEGSNRESEEHLRAAYKLLPHDQASAFGLAQCLERSGDNSKLAEADNLYIEAININPATQIAELARRSRSQLAQQSFRHAAPGGVRMDAVMYCLSALQEYAEMSNAQVQGVAFEIGMLGMNGLDTNDSTTKYKLRSIPGNYSGLQLVSMMYVGFKQIDPSLDVGFDLSKEYEVAKQLFSGGGKQS